MNLQQDRQITKVRLMPIQLDENDLGDDNRYRWGELLSEVISNGAIVSNGASVSAIVFDNCCFVHDLAAPSLWHHYQFRERARSYAIGYDSRRLWLITEHNQLAAFDVQSGEWWKIEHKMLYKKLIHVDKVDTEEHIVVQCSGMHAIDVLKLQDEHLMYVTTIPVSWHENTRQTLDIDIMLSPEEDKFFIVERIYCKTLRHVYAVETEMGWRERNGFGS